MTTRNQSKIEEKVLPQLERTAFAQQLELQARPNVMDLGDFTEEVQALVIASCLEELWSHAHNTYIVIPEAWAFIPQSRGNPVKWAAQHVIRQGAAVGVYLVLDSQDITSIDKALLKSVDCWLLGRQREVNEVKRVLDQLPTNTRPSAQEVTQLEVGQFYVSAEDWCKKVYVQPAWIDEMTSISIARGVGRYHTGWRPARPDQVARTPGPSTPPIEALERETQELREKLAAAEAERDQAQALVSRMQAQVDSAVEELTQVRDALVKTEEQLVPWRKFREGLNAILPRWTSAPSTELDFLADQVSQRLRPLLGSPAAPVAAAPLEALKSRYQQETVDRLMDAIEVLTPQQRRTLQWLTAVGDYHTFVDVARANGWPTSGNGYMLFSKGVNDLVKAGWVTKDPHSGLKGALDEKVRATLKHYQASEQNIGQVYDHLLARLAEAPRG